MPKPRLHSKFGGEENIPGERRTRGGRKLHNIPQSVVDNKTAANEIIGTEGIRLAPTSAETLANCQYCPRAKVGKNDQAGADPVGLVWELYLAE